MKCEIIVCDRSVFSGEVESLYTRTPRGWLGVLPRHAPAAFALENAPLKIRTSEGERSFHVKNGFVRVTPTKVAVFADELEEEHAP